MKLYYSPGSCSMAVHIALREAGVKFEMEKVDLKSKKTETGKDFNTVCEKGYVPVLELDNGEIISEAAAILQYVADSAPDSKLAPKAGTMERVRLNEWLNYVTSELHKNIGSLFSAAMPESYKEVVKQNIAKRLDYVEKALGKNQFITGADFTIVDAYAATVFGWHKMVGVSLDAFPNIQAFRERVAERPAVRAAMEAEGILKKAA